MGVLEKCPKTLSCSTKSAKKLSLLKSALSGVFIIPSFHIPFRIFFGRRKGLRFNDSLESSLIRMASKIILPFSLQQHLPSKTSRERMEMEGKVAQFVTVRMFQQYRFINTFPNLTNTKCV